MTPHRLDSGNSTSLLKIMDAALKQASSSNKNVFLIFHATWCPCCKPLDAALTDPDARPVIHDYYVVPHLDVLERGEKAQTVENPGGKDIMKVLEGENSGLPFYERSLERTCQVVLPEEQLFSHGATSL